MGTSRVGSFYPGGPDLISLTFTVNDDNDPETEETFTFELKVISEGVTVNAPRVAAVTIAANDDAYGVFSFVDVRTKTLHCRCFFYNINFLQKVSIFDHTLALFC